MNIGTIVAGIMIIGLIICFAISGVRSRGRSTDNYRSSSSSGGFGGWAERRRRKKEEKERRREDKLRLKEDKLRRKAENYRMKEERRYNRGNKMIGRNRGYGNNQDSRYDQYGDSYGDSRYNSRNSRYNNRRNSGRYSTSSRYNDDGYDDDGNFRFREGTRPSYGNSDDMYVPSMGDKIRDTFDTVASGAKSVKHRVKASKETVAYTGEKLADLKESTVENALGAYDKSVQYAKKGKEVTEEVWHKSEKIRNATGRVFKRTATAAMNELKETTKNIRDMKTRDREKESKRQSNKTEQKDNDAEPSNRKNNNDMEPMEEFEE